MFKKIIPRIKPAQLALELIVALLIILWLYTGINKLLDYEQTRVQMGRSPFIEPIAGFTAIAVPIGELILAILLIFRKTKLPGLYGSLFLMTLFTGYVYIMLNYSYDRPCSCGGVLSRLSWQDHLYFNAGFTILAMIGILLYNFKQSNHPEKSALNLNAIHK